MGHTVYGTAGDDRKCQAVQSLGAQLCFNYKNQDFAAEVLAATDRRGVDVILDMVGGAYLPRNLTCLADEGRLAIIALLGGAKAELDMGQVLRRRLTITGSTLRPREIAFKAAIAQKLKTHIWPLLDSHKIKPVICATFPLQEAAQAHRLMESSQHIGKIVLTV